MLASQNYIELALRLAEFEVFRSFSIGAHLVRGYADLGHEEFIMVGPGKLVSLYTGTPSALPEGHEEFFTRIPSTEELCDAIVRQNYDLLPAEFKNQREWQVRAQHIESKQSMLCEHREFECALSGLLLKILEQSRNSHV